MSKSANLIACQAPDEESKDKLSLSSLPSPCGDGEELLNYDKVVMEAAEVAVEYPENIQAIMSSLLDPIGMDVHPFLVSQLKLQGYLLIVKIFSS